jgi:hypothetical protein
MWCWAANNVAHVGRAAEDDGVGGVEHRPLVVADGVDGDQMHCRPGRFGATSDGLRQGRGVAEA